MLKMLNVEKYVLNSNYGSSIGLASPLSLLLLLLCYVALHLLTFGVRGAHTCVTPL